MDRSSAVRQLPASHAVAIRLRDGGLDDHVIALALELDDDEVPMLMQIAHSKLDRIMALPVLPESRDDGVGTRQHTIRESHKKEHTT